MKTLNLLLGSADRRINNLVLTATLDTCYNRATVECTRLCRLGEFVRHGCSEIFDMLVLAPAYLLPEHEDDPGVSPEQTVQAVCRVRNHRSVPLVVLAVPADNEVRLLEAGANAVMAPPFSSEKLKTEFGRVLGFTQASEAAAEEEAGTWSLASLLWRGLGRRAS